MVTDLLEGLIGSNQQTSQHAFAKLITSDRHAVRLHATDNLLGAIIGPGNIILPGKYPILGPMLTQVEEKVAELIHRR